MPYSPYPSRDLNVLERSTRTRLPVPHGSVRLGGQPSSSDYRSEHHPPGREVRQVQNVYSLLCVKLPLTRDLWYDTEPSTGVVSTHPLTQCTLLRVLVVGTRPEPPSSSLPDPSPPCPCNGRTLLFCGVPCSGPTTLVNVKKFVYGLSTPFKSGQRYLYG